MADINSAPESPKPHKPRIRNTVDQPQIPPVPPSYEERSKLFLSHLHAICEAEGVKVAVAIIFDPKIPEKPIIYGSGHVFEQAQAGCDLAKVLKNKLLTSEDLTV